ncbi:MAG: RNA polymerase sigma-70 factor [Flavobacteriales bacterium]|nr:RNA polymerase sigma-70 factor [Flavobacteriales bacterium]
MFASSNNDKTSAAHLEKFFKQHYKALCFAANNILSDYAAAEDVVQDVFVNLLNKEDEIEINSSLKGYIFRSTINASLNYVKKNKNTVPMETEILEVHHYSGDFSEDSLEQLELEESINQAINLLPPKCKAVFLLNRYEDMKYREVAEHLGVSVKTVENQMGKALRRLRNHLKPYILKKSTIIS